MARKPVTHESYMRSLNTSAAAYFGFFAVTLIVFAVFAAVTGESVVGVVGVALISLLCIWVTISAVQNLVKARREQV